ncbi:class I SAM-dependent methyltransferase [Aquibacillus salsiterrae]|uniref:Class I SAM-dependent methyltransferase n=1 Tax=Aquibacillus salsiterrae TaxID=2950439 RepID=A0A9X3WG27_9BACI|nr:class I SAM-dependent methyltransferase [Aquibacillus salsiterrae]MDC3417786.1 class I SAM-dependent methyltransferase [Aquibacillus salsiterrae]
MSEQYFSSEPQTKSNPKTWTFELKGHLYTFTSDEGVFSKSEIDFGSRTLIDEFRVPSIPGDILDLGCGYGPIGLSIAKTNPERKVVLCDINERAVALAKKNAEQNNIDNVEIAVSDRLESFQNRKFASVVTNPPIRAGKKVVHQLFEDSFKALLPNGELWVVIQKKQGAASAQDKIEYLFSHVEIVKRNKGYFILYARKNTL